MGKSKLFKAATKDFDGAWRMYLPIEFEDVADEKMNKNSIQTSWKMK